MKITIEADSKEIADLALKLQNRQTVEKAVELYPKKSGSTLAEAIRGMLEARAKEQDDKSQELPKGANHDCT